MLALIALTTALPNPATDVALLSGARRALTTAGESGSTALNDAALVTASVVVWAVLGWGCLVLGLAALARIPGALGRFGRVALGRVTPATVRRVVIAGMGVSVLAGAAACGVDRPAAAIPQAAHGSSAVVLTSSAVVPGRATIGPARTTIGPGRATIGPGGGAVGPLPQLGSWSVTAERGVPSPTAASAARAARAAVPAYARAAVPACASAVGAGDAGPAAAVPAGVPAGVAVHAGAAVRTVRRGDSVNVDWPVQRPTTAPRATTQVDLDWPTTSSPAPTGRQHEDTSTEIVIVRPGDSLWLIAATELGPGADDASIDATWRQWYQANRSVIGSDPDLIEPGQQLHAPHPPTDHSTDSD